MKMTLSHHYLKVNLTLLDALGYPKAHAYDILEIDESALALPHERLSLENFQACLSAAAEFTGDNNIGLRLGHKFRVSAYGETGSLYAYCEDLEEVISMNNLYQKIAIDAGQVEYLQNTNGTHHMCFRPYYSNASEYRLLTDVILASFITAYRWLSWGSGEDIICTHLPYVPQDQIQTYSDILQTPVKRDLNEICVQFSDVAMSQKITTRNPERLAQARFKLDKLLGGHIASSAFEDAVEAAIRAALEAGSISSDVVANRLGLSGSVFRARLAATGEGMRPRLEKIRKSLFIEKFYAGCSFAQIAVDLAYNDQAAMNRAFWRWFDMTPTQWRAMQPKPKSKSPTS